MAAVTTRYDVAVLGAGPAGMANACLVGALNNRLKIAVFDKRLETTRNHSLFIAKDSIDSMSKLLTEALANPAECVNVDAAKKLLQLFGKWRHRAIPTVTIETTLAQFASQNLKIQVFRDRTFNVKAPSSIAEAERAEAEKEKKTHFETERKEVEEKGKASEERAFIREEEVDQKMLSFDDFIRHHTHEAEIIIGADGAKSEVRKAIGCARTSELTLSYLIELKYNAPSGFSPRGKIEGSVQASKSEGFDFETVGRPRTGKPQTVALHRFVDLATYQSLIDGIRGTPEKPWSMEELRRRGKSNPQVQKIVEYLDRHFFSHGIKDTDYSHDRIASFPMTIYRSNEVSKLYQGRIVLLLGDASSGMVLERGVNKAFKEADLCARAILKHFQRRERERTEKLTASVDQLPQEFQDYQTQSRALFESEKRWARLKNTALKIGEFLLKVLIFPFKLVIAPFAFIKKLCTDGMSKKTGVDAQRVTLAP